MPLISVRINEPLPVDDDALMANYLRGDAAAFTELYARYEAPLFGFCVRYLGDRDAAADAFQETFMRVVDGSGSYVPRGRFRSWLFTIARRVCVDAVRADRKHVGTTHPLENVESHESNDPARVVGDRDEIERHLSTLSREQREVLLLHRYHGFAYAEIATMTRSTEAAVKQKAYRALRALRGAHD